MLNVIYIQSGNVKIEKERFSLAQLLKEIEMTMRPVAKDKNVTIKIGAKEYYHITLHTNLQMTKNIIESFILNAINYSNPGQEVRVGCKESEQSITFYVNDDGIGIPDNEKKMIFERFYRASNAQKMKTDGTGLGLYTASLMAKKIGADISFESKEGQGTTFYLKMSK